ncbi:MULTISPECIES: hypothetical protein [unclassified Bradyrhizobium]|uniref:hypothetical protein n=1 Tax=unclassified Bradyrhizobium TaxID=2631580 RepID=UPI001FF7A693|nr:MULTISPECIES: hypothetical protein [unclassified Bradyrhizobium]MCK1294919.1 hypothetical protein [Bradyrhizobium sp. 30]MCK1304749.1 hypothetical protein [Bradyrhizobium sp. 45]MCK1314130.1 hypothetical protein [Bradyrhizobium sp. 23]MCK1505422.1 hypothetical protein [Bradyrhizobium sp. 18]MCK1608141.1 hypothetical protein [Bradyrhizobium sp. 163]
MRDPADEMAHRFDLLGLQERHLRPLALRAFCPEKCVNFFQGRGALRDKTL